MITLDNIKITLQVSSWDLVTTGYLDPNGYKKAKGQATSQIELTGQKSCTNSTLTLTNGEAVSNHCSYDRTAEEMGVCKAQVR